MFEREMSEHIAGFEKHLHALRANQYLFGFFCLSIHDVALNVLDRVLVSVPIPNLSYATGLRWPLATAGQRGGPTTPPLLCIYKKKARQLLRREEHLLVSVSCRMSACICFSPSHCVTQCHVCIRWPNKVGSLPKLEPAANEGEDGRLRQTKVERGGGEPSSHFLFPLVDLQQHNTVTESCGWTCTEDMHRWPQKQGTRHAVHSMLSPCRVSRVAD